jgi:hypothetical protein
MIDTFVKRYQRSEQAIESVQNYRWLKGLDCIRVPELLRAGTDVIEYEYLSGHPLRQSDLAATAMEIGRLGGEAYRQRLCEARLDRLFHDASGIDIPDFFTPRRSLANVDRVDCQLPVTVYKDANVRNFLQLRTELAIVDFDDLTLAPFGYDLAKLVVSAAMTFGDATQQWVREMLDVYNLSATDTAGADVSCTPDAFVDFLDIHDELTRKYLGRHGYRYSWSEVVSWRTL